MLNYYRSAFGPLNAGPGESEKLPKLSMPVLQFHGLKDKAVDKDGLRDTWNWINKDYTRVTIPSSDHWVQRDAADLVNKTMLWWLKCRPSRQSRPCRADRRHPCRSYQHLARLIALAHDGRRGRSWR